MAKNIILSHSMLTALFPAFFSFFFDHALAEFRIHDINGIPVNNQLPDVTDIIVDFPVLFDTEIFIPKFENTDEIIILTNLIPDRTSPRIPLNVRYSASKDEWTRIADWNIEAGASEARPFSRPHKLNSDSGGDSSINPTGNWMINFTPHGIVATNNGVQSNDGKREPAYSLMTNIFVTDPEGYQRYFKFAQELPCTDLGEHGLFCEQLIIEFEDAADGLVSSASTGISRQLQGISKSNLPPPLSFPLPDTATDAAAAAAAEDDDFDNDDYIPPAADLSDDDNGNEDDNEDTTPPPSSFRRQPGRSGRRFE